MSLLGRTPLFQREQTCRRREYSSWRGIAPVRTRRRRRRRILAAVVGFRSRAAGRSIDRRRVRDRALTAPGRVRAARAGRCRRRHVGPYFSRRMTRRGY